MEKLKKKLQKLMKNEKGLTLVELLAVIVILGIIAAIAIPAIGGIIDNSRQDAHIANAEAMVSASRLAVISENVSDNTRFYAVNAATDEFDLVAGDYMEAAPQDPEEDATYGSAFVDYEDGEYLVTLGTEDETGEYFQGDAITIIREEGRESLRNQ